MNSARDPRRIAIHGPGRSRRPLAARFGAPPFSVLDARQAYWRARRRKWDRMGLVSCEGRGEGLIQQSPTGADPQFYEKKRRAERDLGRTLSTAEFLSDHYLYDTSSMWTSSFDPVLAEILTRWFSPPTGSTLDPFAGGPVRGVVSGAMGRSYLGIDIRAEQVNVNRQKMKTLNITPSPKWAIGDARNARRICGDQQFDFVLTCPPYADLEVYSDDPCDLSTMPYELFCDALGQAFAAVIEMLRDNRFGCVVIGDVRDRRGMLCRLVARTMEMIVDAGAEIYNHAILLTPCGSAAIRAPRQFERSRKLVSCHQHVVVFVKGDPKIAVRDVGPIDDADFDDPQGVLF